MALESVVVGEVERAGARSRSATVAPRYFWAQILRRSEGGIDRLVEFEGGGWSVMFSVSGCRLGEVIVRIWIVVWC